VLSCQIEALRQGAAVKGMICGLMEKNIPPGLKAMLIMLALRHD
jgi:hypothetical protein